ncbi:inheritance of peroxisomes protein 1-domain-containing protein [Tuber brumale]|nr:inheritance of peroxisomes protein 1-domain-containing protein [Tuber brumale]
MSAAWSQRTPLPRRTVPVPITPRRRSPSGAPLSPSPGSAGSFGGSASASNDQNIDLLFAHSSARIVSFDAAASAYASGQLIPWTSATERTIASGPIRIYKTIPHNIAFLQSGPALRPVLSKSQCWNVDGRGVFCLQIRPGSYWRLEILEDPGEDAIKAIQFKGVLITILAYEITTCPFLRSGGCVTEVNAVKMLEPSRVWRRPRAATLDIEVVREEESAAVEEVLKGAGEVEIVEERVEDECVEVIIGDQEQEGSGNGSDTTTLVHDEMDHSISSIDVGPCEEALGGTSAESKERHDFSLPFRSPRGSMFLCRPYTVPPQLTDTNAFPTISRPSSRSSTPDSNVPINPIEWHTLTPQLREVRTSKRRDRNLSAVGLDLSANLVPEPAQISPSLSTPTLWSGSESDDSWSEIATPQRPSLYRNTDSTIAPRSPTLSRSTSSLVLSKTAGFVGAAADLVVVKPSSYIAGMMFSIASRIATRAVSGAAYTLAERYGPAVSLDPEEGFDYEDDFGVRLRPGRKDPWDKDVWGPENV